MPTQTITNPNNPNTEIQSRDIEKRIQSVYQNNLVHLSQFMRLQVNLTAIPSISSTSSDSQSIMKQFSVLLERNRSIQDLARLIEAEYAFLTLSSSSATPAASSSVSTNPTLDTQQQNISKNDLLIPCISVVMIYDIAKVPLKFTSSIAEVLNNGDQIRVVASLIDDNLTIRDLVSARVKGCSLVQNYLCSVCSAAQTFATADIVSTDELLSDHLLQNNNLHLLTLLHNMEFIGQFQEFCMQDFEIETLLLWLEIEVFRGLARLSLENIGLLGSSVVDLFDDTSVVVSSSTTAQNNNTGSKYPATHVEMTNPKYPFLLLHARYIYHTFLADGSSLRVNIPSNLLDSVDWPLPALDPVTGWHLPLRVDIWDDVQEHVFSYLCGFVYPKFMESDQFSGEWKKVLATPISSLIQLANSTGTEQQQYTGWFLVGEHYKKFQQDVEGMEKAISEALAQNGEPGAVFQSNVAFYGGVPSSAANKNHRYKNVSSNQLTSGNRSRSLLEIPMPASASHISPVVAMPPSFFGQGPKITNAQKLRRIQREKKLKKFFGEAPIQEDSYADAQLKQFSSGASAGDEGSDGDEVSIQSQPTGASTRQDKSTSAAAIVSADTIDDPSQYKVKKIDKLNGFFGVQKLPPELLFEQKVIDRLELIYENEQPTPSTVNELSEDSKRKLVQRTKKLRGLLGSIDESALINSLQSGGGSRATDLDSSPASPAPLHQTHQLATPPIARKMSVMSFESSDSGSSLTILSDRAKRFRDEKLYRRKKLEKIRQFLGEKVSSRELEMYRPLNPTEKQLAMRRVQKLQAVFGETPPSESVVTKGNVIKLLEMAGIGGEAVKYVLGNDDKLRELVDVMEEFDRAEGVIPEISRSSLEIGESEGKNVVTDDTSSDLSLDADQAGGAKQQRKRIGKLTKFFGSTAGHVSNNMNNGRNSVIGASDANPTGGSGGGEDEVLEDLGRHLRNVIDPDVIKAAETVLPSISSGDELYQTNPK